ncbi:MAG: calcium-binding protein [Exiguobacterium profundum]|nr:MAG: calcium-binding protein [Exiguobacterium profundum]
MPATSWAKSRAPTDRVQSSITYTLTNNVETLELTGSSGLSGTGNSLANTLIGNSGYNLLSGLGGNDTLSGGGGNDTLVGGTGADHFLFTPTSGGTDVISDFNQLDGGARESDVLEFQGLLHGTFAWLGTGSFTRTGNTEARLVGDTLNIDTDGNGSTNIYIKLTGITSAADLLVTDFLFT